MSYPSCSVPGENLLSQPLIVVEAFRVQQNNRIGHIYMRVMKHRIYPRMLSFGENRKKPLYADANLMKIGFQNFLEK